MSYDFEQRAMSVEKLPGEGLLQRYQSNNWVVKELDPTRMDDESVALKAKILVTHASALKVMPDLITEHQLPDELRANVHRKVWGGLLGTKVEPVTFDRPIIRERNDGTDAESLLKAAIKAGDYRGAEVLMKEVISLSHTIIRRGFFPMSIAPSRFARTKVEGHDEMRMQDLELLDSDRAHVARVLRNDGHVDRMRTSTVSNYGEIVGKGLDNRDLKRFFEGYFVRAVENIYSYDSTAELGHERRSGVRRDPRVGLVRKAG